jgi:dCMP deaminase
VLWPAAGPVLVPVPVRWLSAESSSWLHREVLLRFTDLFCITFSSICINHFETLFFILFSNVYCSEFCDTIIIISTRFLMSDRKSWHTYFMKIAAIVAERATCSRAKIGAVIVKDKNIIATGYNGSPAGHPHCTDVGCLVYVSRNPDGEEEENCFRTIHAEINAIAQAAKHGVSIDNADIYITASPCYHCLKTLVNCGIKTIYYSKPYKIEKVRQLLEHSHIEMICVPLDPA